jgi:single-strand DNA-binding protein
MKSLNKVLLIGNLTRDPELRYTASGVAVCSFGLATNRQWTTETGEKKEEVEYHNLTAWNKLADICGQLLKKGRKVYIEGRLQTRSWAAQDGTQKKTTEIIVLDMILLDSRREGEVADLDVPTEVLEPSSSAKPPKGDVPAMEDKKEEVKKKDEKKVTEVEVETATDEDIPF